jgi:hypothetical protein
MDAACDTIHMAVDQLRIADELNMGAIALTDLAQLRLFEVAVDPE